MQLLHFNLLRQMETRQVLLYQTHPISLHAYPLLMSTTKVLATCLAGLAHGTMAVTKYNCTVIVEVPVETAAFSQAFEVAVGMVAFRGAFGVAVAMVAFRQAFEVAVEMVVCRPALEVAVEMVVFRVAFEVAAEMVAFRAAFEVVAFRAAFEAAAEMVVFRAVFEAAVEMVASRVRDASATAVTLPLVQTMPPQTDSRWPSRTWIVKRATVCYQANSLLKKELARSAWSYSSTRS